MTVLLEKRKEKNMKNKFDWLQLFGEGAGEAGGSSDGTPEASGEAGEDSREAQELPSEARQVSGEAQEPEEQGLLEQQPEPEPSRPDETLVRRHWQGVERIYRELEHQAQELKQLYPDLDLGSELRDPRFSRMLRCGVDMRSAYQAIHAAQIIPAAMQFAARRMAEQLSSSMGSLSSRPAENGLTGGGAVRMGGQVSRMSRQDYDRVCRMVERGERVSFG